MLWAPNALGLSRRDGRQMLRDDPCSAVDDIRRCVASGCARMAPSRRLEGGALTLSVTYSSRVTPKIVRRPGGTSMSNASRLCLRIRFPNRYHA